MASRSIASAERLPLRGRIRIARRLALIAALLGLCVPGHYLWRLAGARSPWPRFFLGRAAWAAGVDVDRRGQPLRGQALFIAKDEMEEWPLLGWLATLNNTLIVDREARSGVAAQAAAVRAALETGQPLTLFAEGTTGDGVVLRPFRSSLVAAVTPPPPGVGIQPVAIDFGALAPVIAWTGDESVGHNAAGILARRGRMRVALHFLPPLAHADFADRKAIAAHSRAAIAAALRL